MSIREVYGELIKILRGGGIEAAPFETKQLLCSLLGVSEEEILLDRRQVTDEEETLLQEAAEKRCSRYPLQYLIGEWEFFGLPFSVGEGVLIPRQDTETLCEVLLGRLDGKKGLKIIDLCSGSGCIAITLDHYLQGEHRVYALEKSPEALFYLKKNKQKNRSGIIVVEDNVLLPQTKETGFDLIVSNPPYLNDADMKCLQQEVSYEPKEALYAPHRGYLFYEKITEYWKERLNPGGILAYEVGIHQEKRVSEILMSQGFENICFYSDLCGIIRVVLGEKQMF